MLLFYGPLHSLSHLHPTVRTCASPSLSRRHRGPCSVQRETGECPNPGRTRTLAKKSSPGARRLRASVSRAHTPTNGLVRCPPSFDRCEAFCCTAPGFHPTACDACPPGPGWVSTERKIHGDGDRAVSFVRVSEVRGSSAHPTIAARGWRRDASQEEGGGSSGAGRCGLPRG